MDNMDPKDIEDVEALPYEQGNVRVRDVSGDCPDIPVRPPYLYLCALAAGLVLDFLMRLDFLSLMAQLVIGLPVFAAGLFMLNKAMNEFAAAGTPVPTTKRSTKLVTTGLYARSRNPIYIALLIVYIGLAFLCDAPMALITMIPLLWVLDRQVVPAEESYLRGRFGKAYILYTGKVKRWL